MSKHGRIDERFAGAPLDGPASVAFGTRRGDEKTLYVLSGAFMRTFGIKPGTPHPALLSTRTRHEGLDVP